MFKKITTAVLIVAIATTTLMATATSASAATTETTVELCDTANADVLRLYAAMFNRSYDAKGGAYWQTQHRNGVSLENIALAMSQGSEFQTAYKHISNNEELVAKVYRNVFKRNADQAGLNYWVAQMEDGLDQHLLIRWMAQSHELKLRYNYEASCQIQAPISAAVAVANIETGTEIAPPDYRSIATTTVFNVTTQYQALPSNAICELHVVNDNSVRSASESTWVRILSNYGEENFNTLEQSAGYEFRHMFTTPAEYWAEKGIIKASNSTFTKATVSCTPN